MGNPPERNKNRLFLHLLLGESWCLLPVQAAPGRQKPEEPPPSGVFAGVFATKQASPPPGDVFVAKQPTRHQRRLPNRWQ